MLWANRWSNWRSRQLLYICHVNKISNNPEKFPDGYVIELNKNEKSEVVKIFDNFGNLLYSPTNPKAFTEKHPYNNRNAILAHASASASAWLWSVIGQPQASATGGAARAKELIVRIVHLIDCEHCFETALAKGLVGPIFP